MVNDTELIVFPPALYDIPDLVTPVTVIVYVPLEVTFRVSVAVPLELVVADMLSFDPLG